MRSFSLLAAVALAAVALAGSGCFSSPDPIAHAEAAIADCRAAPVVGHVLYFGPSLSLREQPQPVGFAPGNAFSSGFLTNDLKEWLSDAAPEGLWLVGNVTLEYWARSTGTPAPLVNNPAHPGEGYHFFNQFGSDRSLQPAFAVEYSDPLPMAGTIDHYTETLQLDAGGFVVEKGDRVRVLLTDLTLDAQDGGGHDILFGGGTPSQVRFSARCFPTLQWEGESVLQQSITLPANQGLLTGAVPASAANQASFDVLLPEDTQRVSISLVQDIDATPVKDDIDITLLDRSGAAVYSVGSPYSDESGTLWLDNLRGHFPDGQMTVQVDSYSGVGYMGTLSVIAEHATSTFDF